MTTLNWKPVNKRQREQYWCGPSAVVARVGKAVLADRNNSVTLVAEIIVTGETVMVHYETAGQEFHGTEYVFHFEKQVSGIDQGKQDIQDIFTEQIYGDTLIQAGYKETY